MSNSGAGTSICTPNSGPQPPPRPVSPPEEETPLPHTIIHVDFTRLTSAGYGTLYGPQTAGLHVGQIIGITDNEADTVQAEVLEVNGDSATIRATWDNVLRAR